jgi:uncharacterized membrane protein
MLPRALIGDTKPENWIGLIDGVYAIVLTLLLIELPSFIIEFAKEYQAHPNEVSGWLYAFLYIIIGYFAVFLIVYDVWAHHRVLLANAFISRFNFAIGAITLFLVSLFPPLTFVINDLRYEFMIGKLSPVGGAASVYWGARYAFYIILACIYGSIALVSTKDLLAFQRLGGAASQMMVLRRLKHSSIVMLFITMLIAFLALKGYLDPPIPLVLVALCTYLPVDRLIVKLYRRLLPRRG